MKLIKSKSKDSNDKTSCNKNKVNIYLPPKPRKNHHINLCMNNIFI